MERFAAIDFETANGKRSSICSIGIAIMRSSTPGLPLPFMV